MKILCVATRLPWPARDGGRVLLAATLEGLAAIGHEIVLVAPHTGAVPEVPVAAGARVRVVPVAVDPRGRVGAWLRTTLSGAPATIEMHRLVPVRAEVARLVAAERFDVVHAEQLQAMSQTEPASAIGLPVVLRAQNVESDLWRQLAALRPGWRLVAGREARRLREWESRAVARADGVAVLTPEDAARLTAIAPAAADRIAVVRAPMPASLPGGTRTLSGAPAVTLVSSAWLPNRDGVEWFLREVWPAVHASLPGAELHLFASGPTVRAPGVTVHEPPADSADAFAPGSILVVPLRMGSGVRIRILEAWARRVPVVATAEAAAGLTDRDGELVRLASTPAGFVEAFRALAGASLAREALVRAARLKLEADHDPVETARALGRVYDAAAARRARALSTKMSAMPPPEEPRS